MKEKWREKTEKIGKLLKLLNEFETPQSGVVFKSYDDYDGTFYGVDIDGETEIAWSDSYICGKRFGWIKWLVENDKIDREKMPLIVKTEGYLADGSDTEYYDMEESLLMLLSIQDEPINFLISILK